MGGVSEAASDRVGVSHRRKQRRTIHALTDLLLTKRQLKLDDTRIETDAVVWRVVAHRGRRDWDRRDLPIDRTPPSLPMLSMLLLLPMLRIDMKLPILRIDAALATDSTLDALSRLQKLL